ncbi:MAG: class I SAM-dependent methyltransferase [Patescibacteria group bacterium]
MKKDLALYQAFHQDRRLQKRIINENDFTYRHLIRILKPYLPKVKKILDIGSGVGTIDFYLASKGKEVTGIEISKSAVELARKNAELFNLNKKITFINAAFPSKIPTKNYDLVIFSEVIEHLEDDAKALRDIRSVLKPNGLLVITTPSLNAPLYRLGLLNRFDKEVGHLRRYTLSNLISLVENNGYKVIQSGRHEGVLRNFLFTSKILGQSVRFIRGHLSNLVTTLDSYTIPMFGESNISIVAVKTS